MGAWPQKFVIGLTGNIATGKSAVRKMCEHLGAFGIDADLLANRAISKGAPGFLPVVEMFGQWLIGSDGQIDRAKLGRLVFSDPDALERLEAIVHPLVIEAINILVKRSEQRVIVIEAIKLIESGLANQCDSVWVTTASPEQQLERLIHNRKMTKDTAVERINAQPSQHQKIQQADIIIRNSGSFDETWSQVLTAWRRSVPALKNVDNYLHVLESQPVGTIIQRARPEHAVEIAEFINKISQNKRHVSRDEIMASFGEKAYLLYRANGKVLGMVGWKVENLVARTDEVTIDPSLSVSDALRLLMNEVERISRELLCEVSLLFLSPELTNQEAALISLGYQRRSISSLAAREWIEAALESMPVGSIMLFKQLRKDRMLRPV